MSGAPPVLLATRNSGKLRELRPLFSSAGLAVIDLVEAGVAESGAEDALEAFDTFEANAVAKARYFMSLTGLVAIADDSGLEVAALGGAPGVHSKRWSGRNDLHGATLDAENNRLLLSRLRGVSDRRARYVCVACAAGGGGEWLARGEVAGVICDDARGLGGFGYDPHFAPLEGDGRSFGELTIAEKSALSHRGRAFTSLLSRMAEAAARD